MSYGIYNKTLKRWVKEQVNGKYIDIVRPSVSGIQKEFDRNAKEVESNSQHMYDNFVIKDYEQNSMKRNTKIKPLYPRLIKQMKLKLLHTIFKNLTGD